MKVLAFFGTLLWPAFCVLAGNPPLETFCPHLPSNASIIWQAPTNQLPKKLWVYKRLPPHPFPATLISNAIVLASLQSKGFPSPSTNDFFISDDKGSKYQAMIPVIFSITPKSGTISYYRPHPDTNLLEIPAGDVVKRLARTHAVQLGIDLGQVASARLAPHFNKDENYNDITSQICGRSVFLPRLLDGICFADTSDDGGNGGFWIEFGSHGQIEGFSIVWPSLERYEQSQTASPQQIVACIRAFKTMTPPIGQETNYFARIKSFAKAKALIITKIIPYYGEWVYGEMPTEDVPSPIIAPFAELQAVADFGNSNTPVRLFSPILSSQATQILIDKTK